MDLGLEARRAVVCGASKGLGFAVAEALLREGARVLITARHPSSLADAATKLNLSTGRLPAWHASDLSVPHDREQLVRTAMELLGGIDLLLVNSGGPPPGPFEAHSLDTWRCAMELSLGPMVHLCQLVLPAMREHRFGRVVQIVSIAGVEVVDSLILSNASRPATIGFAKALAREYAPHGVLINSICPGLFLTDRVRELAARRGEQQGKSQEEMLSIMTGDIPLGRAGDPCELGDLAAFLLSPRNTYITGEAILIDGAMTRRIR